MHPHGDAPDDDLTFRPLSEIRLCQDRQVATQIALCAQGSRFYQATWARAGIDPAAIKTIDDLERLPLTHKSALMDEPEAFRLHLPHAPLEERALWEINYTTGSTGDPTPLYVTTHDYQAYLFQSQRVAAISGIRNTDILANLFPLTKAPMGAFVRSVHNAYAAGATIAGALTGARFGQFDVQRSLDDAVRMVERHRATVLWGVTSFVRRVLMRAAELQADFRSVRMCGVTGEASTPAMREDLRVRLRALGAQGSVIFDRYGSTETGGLAQCHEEADWHNPAPELLFHEVVDPDSGRRLKDGERGALAVTHLNRRGTALVRYLVGDIVSLTHAPCPHCGRTSERIVGPIQRTKDLVKVKGMLINPAVLMQALGAIKEVDEFQVVLTRQNPADPLSMDEMVLRIATDVRDRDTLVRRLVETTQGAVQVRPRVVFEDASAIYDPMREAKSVRLVDKR